MKTKISTLPPGCASAVTAGVFLAITALTSPASAATPSQSPAPAHVTTAAAHESIDSRINSLHSRFQITQAQEVLWQKVAQVMRDNSDTMNTLRATRMSQMNSMSAMDDLKSYGQAADAHADGIRKLTPVFQTLYDSMSGEQKKNADLIFRTDHHHPTKKS
jgi:hypothetical protein